MKQQNAAIVVTMLMFLVFTLVGCGPGQSQQGFKVIRTLDNPELEGYEGQFMGQPKVEGFIGQPVRLIDASAGVGTVIDVTVTVVSWRYSSGNADLHLSPGVKAKLVVANCAIKNNSKDIPVKIYVGQYEMYKDFGGMGRNPPLSSPNDGETPQEIKDFEQPHLDLSKEIQPGGTVSGNVILQVFDDSEFFALEFHIPGFEFLRIKSCDPRPGECGQS